MKSTVEPQVNLISSLGHNIVKPKIICLTPIRNEAWILDRFLKCSSLWADHIIIADQKSTDSSREIAKCYPKVTLIENPSPMFNEPERQKLLIEAARKIQGPRLLITLDADEFLSANFMDSPEWSTILHAPAGTVIKFQWVNLLPDMCSCWLPKHEFAWGFIDDGSEHFGENIHSPRIPLSTQMPSIVLRQIKVLHYQYTDWERMRSKQRWYQCWERLNLPLQSTIDVYRRYHHMDTIPSHELQAVCKEWLAGYEQQGIDMTSICRQPTYWWDKEILKWFDEFGTATFKQLDIWSVDWNGLARKFTDIKLRGDYADPRSYFEKVVHRWIRKTQSKSTRKTKFIETLLKRLGW